MLNSHMMVEKSNPSKCRRAMVVSRERNETKMQVDLPPGCLREGISMTGEKKENTMPVFLS